MTRTNPTQLFCVPHAGGSAGVFRPWQRSFPDQLDVFPLEPAGRGSRRTEPFETDLLVAAADLAQTLAAQQTGDEYALLGHCMGGLLAYEMVCYMELHGMKLPQILIVSGRNPPHLQTAWGRRVAQLPDNELYEELESVGGVPKGLSRAMAEGFLHIIRNDQKMVHAYTPDLPVHKISVPVLILAGQQDEMTQDKELQGWSEYTNGPVKIQYLPGGHYFLYDWPEEVAKQTLGLQEEETKSA